MAKRVLLCVCLVMGPSAVFAAEQEWMVDDTRTASRAMAERGVHAYRISTVEDVTSVQLLGKDDATIGTVKTRMTRDWTREIEYTSAAAGWTVLWDAKQGALKLLDATGEYSYTMNAESKATVATPEALARLDVHRKSFEVALNALADVEKHGTPLGTAAVKPPASRNRLGTPSSNSWEDPGCIYGGCGGFDEDLTWSDTLGGSSGQRGCSGPWVRGTTYALEGADTSTLIKSMACYQAQQDANIKCWNRYCVGCCLLLECDANCLAGDYFCLIAGVTGRACS